MPQTESTVNLRTPLFRGKRRLRIALVDMPNAGKSTLFNAVSSTSPHTGELTGTHRTFGECTVQIGLDEASVIDLPSIRSLHDPAPDDQSALKYLLWGDQRPPVSAHDADAPPAPFSPPDLIIQVVDATRLESHLELTLELAQLGRPMVIALNMMDEAWKKGLYINIRALRILLGVRLMPTVALMGKGISELFAAAVDTARDCACPPPQPLSRHIQDSLQPLSQALDRPDIHEAFRVPHPMLLTQFAAGDPYFEDELRQHFPQLLPGFEQLREAATLKLPRPLPEELHAERHHRAATLYEAGMRMGAPHLGRGLRFWLDELLDTDHDAAVVPDFLYPLHLHLRGDAENHRPQKRLVLRDPVGERGAAGDRHRAAAAGRHALHSRLMQ